MQPEAPSSMIFAQLAADGADASRIAGMATGQWRQIEAALAPIIGQPGVAALFKRSLHLARTNHPVLHAFSEVTLQPAEYAGLHAALAQQTSVDAAAANDALLQTFRDLLTNLIGDSLTERLLRSAWTLPSSSDLAQDPTPCP